MALVAERLGLSASGYDRVLRVVRTIADLEGSAGVESHHIGEAVSFRPAIGGRWACALLMRLNGRATAHYHRCGQGTERKQHAA